MNKGLLVPVIDFWVRGNARTILLKKNILGSFFLRGGRLSHQLYPRAVGS